MPDSVRPHRRQPTRLPHPWDSPGKNTGVGCHFLLQCMKMKSESEVAQSCPTLCDPMDCSLPGSSVHGILQARVLEWGAIAFSMFLYWQGLFPFSFFQEFFFIFAFLFKIIYLGAVFWNYPTWCSKNFLDLWFGVWYSVQFSSFAQSCLTLWDPMDCNTPGLPVHHQLPGFTQSHVHWIGDAIQPSHPLSSPSSPSFNLPQHQDLFKWVSSSHLGVWY